MTPQLIYIWIGKKIPEWAAEAVTLSSRYCGVDAVLIASREVARKISFVRTYCLEDFYERELWFETLFEDKAPMFRDGFWIKTLERFFVMEAFAGTYSVDRFFHAELDNLLFDIRSLASVLDRVGNGFFCPRDAVSRGIASLIYVNDLSRLQHMNNWFRCHYATIKNEMELLGHMLEHEPGFYALPTETALQVSRKANWDFVEKERTEGIFDAAAMGQFLFGIDPRNVKGMLFNGFVNENALIDFHRLRFTFIKDEKTVWVSYGDDDKLVRCYNLHVHSKIFRKIIKDSWFMKVFKKSNIGEKTFICLNISNWKIFREIEKKLRRIKKDLTSFLF